jgi:hypothetical protein
LGGGLSGAWVPTPFGGLVNIPRFADPKSRVSCGALGAMFQPGSTDPGGW